MSAQQVGLFLLALASLVVIAGPFIAALIIHRLQRAGTDERDAKRAKTTSASEAK